MTFNHITKTTGFYILTLILGAAVISPFSANAESAPMDILPPVMHAQESDEKNITETHSTLNLTLDKSELIHFDDEVGSIIIGSPVHINILADSAKTIVVVPRAPGATHFSILDKKGQVLMQRHVIVAAPTEDYVRVKRTCTDDDCQGTSVFYCPDMCHEIGIAKEK